MKEEVWACVYKTLVCEWLLNVIWHLPLIQHQSSNVIIIKGAVYKRRPTFLKDQAHISGLNLILHFIVCPAIPWKLDIIAIIIRIILSPPNYIVSASHPDRVHMFQPSHARSRVFSIEIWYKWIMILQRIVYKMRSRQIGPTLCKAFQSIYRHLTMSI